MNENLNLLEILKDAPKGTKLYSTICGEMELVKVLTYTVICKDNGGVEWNFKDNGHLFASNTEDGECVLFPSKEQRDWSKFKLDLPIDTPVMVADASNINSAWHLAFYYKDEMVFINGYKSRDMACTEFWDYIVPVKDFDFENLESNKERSIC